ncbi:hypothetical protein MMC29_004193 [Sticta canariensis]|nr:hypothetical protein [Sticta canariensis]
MEFEMAYNLTLDLASSKKKPEKAEEAKKAKESEWSATLAAEKSAQPQRARDIDRLNFQDPVEEGNDEPDGASDSSDDECFTPLKDVDTENPIVKDGIKVETQNEDEERFLASADFEDGLDGPPDFFWRLRNRAEEKPCTRHQTPN